MCDSVIFGAFTKFHDHQYSLLFFSVSSDKAAFLLYVFITEVSSGVTLVVN